jgi:hypothetical protein
VRPGAGAPPILDLIAEREANAGAAAERLREQISALTEQLTAAETELAELAITRKTLITLTGEPGTPVAPAATITSPAYQQILAAFTTASGPMRAKDICRTLGHGTTAKDTENLRAKLKRLVARHILIEAQPGLFTLAPTTPSAEDPGQDS